MNYRVVEHPWQGDSFVRSEHTGLPSALCRIAQIRENFRLLYPAGYGVRWAVERASDGRSTTSASRSGLTHTPSG